MVQAMEQLDWFEVEEYSVKKWDSVMGSLVIFFWERASQENWDLPRGRLVLTEQREFSVL